MDINSLHLPKAKENQLRSVGLNTVEEVASFFPKKYLDFSKTTLIKDAENDMVCRIVGKIVKYRENSRANMIIFTITDSSNEKMNIIWFHTNYPAQILKEGNTAVFAGLVKENEYGKQMIAPFFSLDTRKFNNIHPVYKKIKGMSDEYLTKTIQSALNISFKDEYLDEQTIQEFSLVKEYVARRALHTPLSMDILKMAQNRVVFDELFKFSYIMTKNSLRNIIKTSVEIKKAETVKPFIDSLPFELTDGNDSQLSVTRQIFKKMREGYATTSLIQGDVGCGKTIVAMLLSLIMQENGYSTAIMAPTNILAQQHYDEFCSRFKNNKEIKPVLITANMKKREKTSALNGIADGTYNVIIGTHAILSDSIKFKKLGLVIVDEEHRFGVEQREKIVKMYPEAIHYITMSATPIPRSLAMTIYGDNVGIYTIKTMPKGRIPVETSILNKNIEAFDRIVEEVNKGHQAYIVCPLIEENNSEKMANVISVNERYEELKKYAPHIKIGMINGKMKKNEIDNEIEKFKNKDYDVLVSTTIVEVGVNVPNATMIVISNAERFGLATLHQLRGRVGRSSFKSYCILLADKSENERLEIMCKTTDGFVIAKEDMLLRGMGDFIGTAQSGDNKAISLMLLNEALYLDIKKRVMEILKDFKLSKKYDDFFELS